MDRSRKQDIITRRRHDKNNHKLIFSFKKSVPKNKKMFKDLNRNCTGTSTVNRIWRVVVLAMTIGMMGMTWTSTPVSAILSNSGNDAFQHNFYYQVLDKTTCSRKINKVMVNSHPFVVYNYNQSYHSLYDKCPHQGASLSKGWINHKGNIHCPYHAFEFDKDGKFCGIPDPSRGSERRVPCKREIVQSFKTFKFDEDIFICPSPDKLSHDLPYYPPEHFNDEFVHTSQSRVIHQDYRLVTENVLDMLHISYIHSFGNRKLPLPSNIQFKELNERSGRSTFRYTPFEMTISNKIGNSPTVVVENEYHLPTTTVTRVIAGDLVKTVLTRSTPISPNKTLFFWRIYRNFWHSKEFPCLNVVGDLVMNELMKITLQEDVDILKHVYPESREGPLVTKYDVTIQKYRCAMKKMENM